jgi:hypothetical protein
MGTPEQLIFSISRLILHSSFVQSFPRLIAALAPEVIVDYTLIVAEWGEKSYTAHEFATE